LFAPGGATGAGWTLYPPLSVQMGPGMDVAIFAIHMLGVSSIIGSINIVTTILNMRAPGMTLMKMPLFVWTWLVTGYLLIVVMPYSQGNDDALDGPPLRYALLQRGRRRRPGPVPAHLLVLRPPEVYILILPAFGIVSEIIPTFARKPLFGYRSMVFATCAIGIVACSVWAHHMFTAGMPVAGQLFFMYASLLVAVPTGVKVFNWVATMWEGSLTFETPMLFAVGFLFVFVVGGITGVILAVAPVDVQLQDTYYVVAHFHYVMVAGSLFGLFAGTYYWLPKWTGHMYDERLGRTHFWLSMIFFNLTFFVMHFLGLAGMPRRIPDYPLQFADFNMIASIGAFGFGLTQLLFLYTVMKCIRGGERPPQGFGTARPGWSGRCVAAAAPYFAAPPVIR